MIPSPALRLLLRLKLRGTLRRSWRKLKTPKGLLLGLLGALLFGLWIASIAFSWSRGEVRPIEPRLLQAYVTLGLVLLGALSLTNAFSFRGLFLPAQEIERLFAAPISAGDLVRYRLWTNVGRGLLGAAVVGLVASRRMPNPTLGFIGTFLAVQTIPVLHQLFAILAGTLEGRLAKRLAHLRGPVIVLFLLAFVPLMIAAANGGTPRAPGALGRLLEGLQGGEAFEHPAFLALRRALYPWVAAITSPDLASFVPWFLLCLLVWAVLAEVTARLPVDYREISLDTAADVAARLRRARRGGAGAAAGKASRRTVGWRIPWVLGRGPAGAVAWRKTASIVRKARGTLLVSVLVLAFVSVLASATELGSPEASAAAAPIFIGVLGTLYLCAGLRFDFRDELDRMEVIKAWPVGPRRLFLGMLLPEVLFVSGLLVLAIVVRALVMDALHPTVLAVSVVLPLVVFAWVALDNAAYLIAPVRFVPGQDGALQNAGRGLLLMLVRVVVLAVVGLLAGLPAIALFHFHEDLGLSDDATLLLSAGLVGLVLLGLNLVLVWIGGWCLRRFDVARDRG